MAEQKKWNEQQVFAGLLALIAWGSVIMQFFLQKGSTINFFSFFTVQCNILVAISMTYTAISPTTNGGKFFTNLSVQSAIALYIFIVGLVYNTVLRGLVPLAGWGLFVDTMLHVVVPVLYLLFWGYMRTKGNLEYKNGVYWLLFPLVYLIYSMVRGAAIEWYPYPFLNAGELGYTKVGINIAVMIAIFLVAGLILIAITRSLKKASEKVD
ncbi:MAG: Pr6Pr family membrane protein [Rhizobacter sp.]|nr:Pr6Pr family membrane protein [Ferruginibacter sp.]